MKVSIYARDRQLSEAEHNAVLTSVECNVAHVFTRYTKHAKPQRAQVIKDAKLEVGVDLLPTPDRPGCGVIRLAIVALLPEGQIWIPAKRGTSYKRTSLGLEFNWTLFSIYQSERITKAVDRYLEYRSAQQRGVFLHHTRLPLETDVRGAPAQTPFEVWAMALKRLGFETRIHNGVWQALRPHGEVVYQWTPPTV